MSALEWFCLIQWAWRARPRLPRLPLLSGWFLLAALAVTAVVAAASAFGAESGSLAAALPTGAVTVLMTGWCGLSARVVRAGWNEGDLDAVRAKAGLEERLGELPVAWDEERCL